MSHLGRLLAGCEPVSAERRRDPKGPLLWRQLGAFAWAVHRRLDKGLSEANQQQAGLGGTNQRSSGLRESAQNRSTVWPVGDQHCIGLKAGLLRDQSKVQAGSSRTKSS